jgi:hypothetical protein
MLADPPRTHSVTGSPVDSTRRNIFDLAETADLLLRFPLSPLSEHMQVNVAMRAVTSDHVPPPSAILHLLDQCEVEQLPTCAGYDAYDDTIIVS